MKTLAVAAVASLALLASGSELVRAEDNTASADYANLTTDDHPPQGDAAVDVVTTYTKPLIIPWETRETGFAAPTAADRQLVRRLHYTALISRYAAEYKVPVELAHAVVQIESNFRPTVKGDAGEIGLMQIKPATARLMGYEGPDYGLYDPETNIRFGMKYLAGAHALGGGKICGTILKYNAGHAAKRMNPTSKRYCDRVQTVLDTTEPSPVAPVRSVDTVFTGSAADRPLVF